MHKYNASLISNVCLGIIFTFSVIFLRPVSIPDSDSVKVSGFSGIPIFSESMATKSSLSSEVFYVKQMHIYCGIGLFLGSDSCSYLEGLIDKTKEVNVNYFMVKNRVGIEYPVLFSLEQGGMTKVSPQQTFDKTRLSVWTAWRSYYFTVGFFGFVALILLIGRLFKVV